MVFGELCAEELESSGGTPDGNTRQVLGRDVLMKIADELIVCNDIDSICRRAVELAREHLGLDRCGIALAEPDGFLRGTYGVDDRGRVISESSNRYQLGGKSLNEVWV